MNEEATTEVVPMSERQWAWIWAHYRELTPQERRIVGEVVHARLLAAIRGAAESARTATAAIVALKAAFR